MRRPDCIAPTLLVEFRMRMDRHMIVGTMAAGLCGLVWLAGGPVMSVRADAPEATALDRPPTGFFVKLELAQGYKETMDSFQTERYKPVNPGTTFNPDVEAIYLVFDLLPRENPANIVGQLFLAKGEGRADDQILQEDAAYLMTTQDSGFLRFLRPKGGWVPGEYKLKIHIGEKITAASQLGTLRFRVIPAK